MTITLAAESLKELPALTMDHLHIDSWAFRQTRDDQSVMSIDAVGVRYAKTPSIVYDTETILASSKDFATDFVAFVALKTGKTPDVIIAELATAKDALNLDYAAGNITDVQMMAMAELSISYFFQVMGKFNIGGMEG